MSKKTSSPKKHASRRFEDIVALIKREILLQTYKVGDALPREEELALQLNVSRPLVREALTVLKAQGYLEAKRGVGGGTFVKDILQSSKTGELLGDLISMGQMPVSDLCNARLIIEPECARAAAMSATPGEIRTFASLLEKTASAPNRSGAIEHASEFHNYIAMCSKNIYFAMNMRAMMGFTQLFIKTLVDLDHDIHDDTFHESIFNAIASHSPNDAYERMFIHVAELKREMCKLEEKFRELANSNLRE